PDWIRQPYDFMEAKNLGKIFGRALEWWVVLEGRYGWQTATQGFPAAHRPQQVADWMRVLRRELTKSPKILDEQQYADRWWGWWSSLQPTWRERGSDGRPLIGDSPGHWESLQKPGKNGFLLVLLSLVWWKECATARTESSWQAAVADVAWVLGNMVMDGEGASDSGCVGSICFALSGVTDVFHSKRPNPDVATEALSRSKRPRHQR
ncbi:hypothetical protein C8Q76DRAFT_630374, partial [Earliella scabrosa]